MVAQVANTMHDDMPAMEPPVELAVYDFDGTLLMGKSPVILMRRLLLSHSLKLSTSLSIGMWGLAYKMHLPVEEAWVRERVFRAFAGKPQKQVDEYLYDFYDTYIASRLRPSLLERIEEDRKQGCVIVTVSATFEPIVTRMAEHGVVDYAIATRMQVDSKGCYLAKVDGLPVEGEEKLATLNRFANERFGEGGWTLKRAYSDHYSDKPLLYASEEAIAVGPDSGLKAAARKNGWEIIDE